MLSHVTENDVTRDGVLSHVTVCGRVLRRKLSHVTVLRKQASRQAGKQASRQRSTAERTGRPGIFKNQSEPASEPTKKQIGHVASMDLGTSRQYEKLKAYS